MNQQSIFRNSLYLITDRHQLPAGQTLPEVVELALIGGVRLIQLREKDLTTAELWPLAQKLRNLTKRFSAKLFINDRIDLALACGADGVHLGEHSLPISETRKLLAPNQLIGVSTHSLEDISSATDQAADFLTFSPIYHTQSKASFGPPQGLERLRQACNHTQLPILALGGVKAGHVKELRNNGASGIALISAIISNKDPQAASEQFLHLLS